MHRFALVGLLALAGCEVRHTAATTDQYDDRDVREAVAEIMCSGTSDEEKAEALSLLVNYGAASDAEEDRAQEVYELAEAFAQGDCIKTSS